MILLGIGGTGKSTVINSFLEFAHNVSRCFEWSYDCNTVKVSDLSGSAASLLPLGNTIYAHAFLNTSNKNITTANKKEWKHTKMLIVDEVSMMSSNMLKNLDRKLKLLTGNNQLFGNFSVILAGDFHQLLPIRCGKPLFNSKGCFQLDAFRRVIFLHKSHRFKNYKKFGMLLQ